MIEEGAITECSRERILTLRKFADETPWDYNWWLAAAKRTDNPCPTILRSDSSQPHYAVIDTDVYAWLRENYGNGGKLRGTETLDRRS